MGQFSVEISALPGSILNGNQHNVRSKIIKEHLNDPAFFTRISALLDEIIRARKSKALDYEAYLKKIADLVKQVAAGHSAAAPPRIDSPGKRALYNNLGENEELALRVDAAVKESRHDGWRGIEVRERGIKAAIYAVLNDKDEVERVFAIIKAQKEY